MNKFTVDDLMNSLSLNVSFQRIMFVVDVTKDLRIVKVGRSRNYIGHTSYRGRPVSRYIRKCKQKLIRLEILQRRVCSPLPLLVIELLHLFY